MRRCTRWCSGGATSWDLVYAQVYLTALLSSPGWDSGAAIHTLESCALLKKNKKNKKTFFNASRKEKTYIKCLHFTKCFTAFLLVFFPVHVYPTSATIQQDQPNNHMIYRPNIMPNPLWRCPRSPSFPLSFALVFKICFLKQFTTSSICDENKGTDVTLGRWATTPPTRCLFRPNTPRFCPRPTKHQLCVVVFFGS